VDIVLVEYTSQISLQKICSIDFSAGDIKITSGSKEIDFTREPVRGAGASAPKVHEAYGAGRRLIRNTFIFQEKGSVQKEKRITVLPGQQ
jgi:hypothetical protein